MTTLDGATVASTQFVRQRVVCPSLPPGSYTLVASQSVPVCPPTPFTVGAGATTTLDLSCDAPIA